MNEEDFRNGQVLLIDKPLNWTSFQVVNKIRWLIKNKFAIKKIKVGHAGTLDPLATGLLIICTGKMTKEISIFQNQTKKYTGTFLIGTTTPSFDLETKPNNTSVGASLILLKLYISELKALGFSTPPPDIKMNPIAIIIKPQTIIL